MVECRNHTPKVVGSNPSFVTFNQVLFIHGVWRSGSVSVLGIEGRVFKSYHPEHFMLTTFHLFLNCFLIISALFLFLSENSVHSILFLVLTFLNASAICFMFGADFLGLLLIIIYVGAIAVLFLFVVMMLNVKIQVLGLARYLPFIILAILVVFNQVLNFTGDILLNFNFLEFDFKHFESLSNDFFLSQTLFNYFLICFLLSGVILLVGMIGAIVLTLNFNTKKRQELPFRQLSRADQVLSFFK